MKMEMHENTILIEPSYRLKLLLRCSGIIADIFISVFIWRPDRPETTFLPSIQRRLNRLESRDYGAKKQHLSQYTRKDLT